MLTRDQFKEIAYSLDAPATRADVADILFAALEAERNVLLGELEDARKNAGPIIVHAMQDIDARREFEERVHRMACALAGDPTRPTLEPDECGSIAVRYVRAVDAALAKE